MFKSRFWGRLLIIIMAFPQLVFKPWRKRPDKVQHVLILSHLLLGDTLMLTALLKNLRSTYPNANLTLACIQVATLLYERSPYGVGVIGFDPKKFVSICRLIYRYRNYDLIVIPGDNRWSWLALAMGGRWIVAFDGGASWKNVPVDELVPIPASRMAWGDMMATLAGDSPTVSVYDPQDWPSPSYKPFTMPLSPYVVLHLGASKVHKYWPPANWEAIADYLRDGGFTVVWSVGSKELALLASIEMSSVDYCYSGNLDLAQFWWLLRKAALLVCPDTGIAHLGRLTNTPTIALFGPGSPLISGAGYFWKNSPFWAIWDENIECRNMNVLFQRHVPWVVHCLRGERECSDPYCMASIPVKHVKDTLVSAGILKCVP